MAMTVDCHHLDHEFLHRYMATWTGSVVTLGPLKNPHMEVTLDILHYSSHNHVTVDSAILTTDRVCMSDHVTLEYNGLWMTSQQQNYNIIYAIYGVIYTHHTLLTFLGIEPIMPFERAQDKKSETIQEGDTVYTKYRGGSHEGEVERIVKDQAEAREEGVANPPKVVHAV
ncbi:hypothetical protein AWENTII_008421 [Aspergillus wentii]